MKKLIKNLFLISFLFILLILLVDHSTSLIINKNANFKIKSNPKYLIFGHSHPSCAFNDSLIHGLKNISKSGESYFYTYFKIKNILNQNKKHKIIFLEFSNNFINKRSDHWIWQNKTISTSYLFYSPFMELKDKYIIFKNNPLGFINNTSISIFTKVKRIVSGNYDYIEGTGEYLKLKRNKTEQILKYYSLRKIKKNSKPLGTAKINIAYLKKIIDLCSQLKIRLILVRSPLHPKWKYFKNEANYKSLLKTKFKNVEYIDFSNFKLKNSEFGDLNHLNYKGANVFSIWFNKLLERGLLEKKNISEFVKNEIKIQNSLSYK